MILEPEKERTCPYCKDPLKGRSDKIYCSRKCKDLSYFINNRLRWNQYMREWSKKKGTHKT